VLISALLTPISWTRAPAAPSARCGAGHIAAEALRGASAPRHCGFIYAAVLAALSGWLYAHFQRAA